MQVARGLPRSRGVDRDGHNVVFHHFVDRGASIHGEMRAFGRVAR